MFHIECCGVHEYEVLLVLYLRVVIFILSANSSLTCCILSKTFDHDRDRKLSTLGKIKKILNSHVHHNRNYTERECTQFIKLHFVQGSVVITGLSTTTSDFSHSVVSYIFRKYSLLISESDEFCIEEKRNLMYTHINCIA